MSGPVKIERKKLDLKFHLYILGFHFLMKKANIRNQYNQVPHLTGYTIWDSDKTQENITHKSTKRSALSQQVIQGCKE